MKQFRSIVAALALVAAAGCGEADGPIEPEAVEAWLHAYGAAWEARDAATAAWLFTPDALYQETPFADPILGRTAIAAYWATVTSDQASIEFDFALLAVTGRTGIARWSANFRSIAGDAPVELNGIFVLEFAGDGLVASLREWWHAR